MIGTTRSRNELDDLAAAAAALSTVLQEQAVPPTLEGLSEVATAIYELSLRIKIVTRWATAFGDELDRAIARANSNLREN